jgi:hypothetical protein
MLNGATWNAALMNGARQSDAVVNAAKETVYILMTSDAFLAAAQIRGAQIVLLIGAA